MQLRAKDTRRERLRDCTCSVCGATMPGYAATRLCPDCRGELYEGLAVRVGPVDDVADPWLRAAKTLMKLWGEWYENLTYQLERESDRE